MILGDLIQWEGKLWLVRKVDHSLATAFLEGQARNTAILGTEADSEKVCQVLCNPLRDWPCLTLPPRTGTFLGLSAARRGVMSPLAYLEHWVKMGEFQMGGGVLLNPALGLIYGDRLIAEYSHPRTHRRQAFAVDIPRHFRPIEKKIEGLEAAAAKQIPKVQPKPEGPPTLYDHLRDDDD